VLPKFKIGFGNPFDDEYHEGLGEKEALKTQSESR
jgi:hypothetical protein